MIGVIHLDCRGAFRLCIHFSDGSAGEHDLSDMVAEPGPLLAPLRDPSYFAQSL